MANIISKALKGAKKGLGKGVDYLYDYDPKTGPAYQRPRIRSQAPRQMGRSPASRPEIQAGLPRRRKGKRRRQARLELAETVRTDRAVGSRRY